MKRILTILALLFITQLACAEVQQIGNFMFDLKSDGTAEVLGFKSVSYERDVVIIPSQVYSYKVTSIGDEAFQREFNIIKVYIPNSVTRIGNSAFSGCSKMEEVTIPNSVTSIGDYAFWKCMLTNVEIPYSVISIGYGAFSNCSQMEEVTISNSVKSIGGEAFAYCSSLKTITIPESVTTIGGAAFYGCKLSEFNFNAEEYSITQESKSSGWFNVGSSVFTSNNGVSTINIGENVSSIPNYAFSESSAETVNFNAINCHYVGEHTFPSTISTLNIGDKVTTIPSKAFGGNNLKSVTIPNSVTSIGSNAFNDCSKMEEVIISNSVTSIGNGAFYGCSGLTSVEIPNSVTSIGSEAFRGCRGLTSVIIGNSVTSIPSMAFRGCSGLTSVEIPNSVTSIGLEAFYGCSSLTSVIIGNSITTIVSRTFSECSSLTSVTLGYSVKEISETAFGNVPLENLTVNCKSMGEWFQGWETIKTLTIGNSVTKIENYAFDNCTGIKMIIIEDGENELSLGYKKSASYNNEGESIFYDCPIETLYLGRDLVYDTSITKGYSPFYNKTNLTDVKIGDLVTKLPDYLFRSCTGLTSITFGYCSPSIGEGVFSNCKGLRKVNISDLAAWCNIEFRDYNNNPLYYSRSLYLNNQEIIELIVPETVTSIKDYTFYSCMTMKSVTIPNSVTSIGTCAFYGCSGLTSLEIPNSVTTINKEAFAFCGWIKSVTIGYSVTSIGESCFMGCDRLKELTSLNPTPPSCGSNSFPRNLETIYVPFGSKIAYQNAEVWKDYNIVEVKFEPEGSLKIHDFVITPEEPYLLSVDFIGSLNSNYTGFKFDIELPESLNINEIDINEALKSAGFTLSIKEIGKSLIRVDCSNSIGQTSTITTGLVSLAVEAPTNAPDGEALIKLSNIYLYTVPESEWRLSDTETTVTIKNPIFAKEVVLNYENISVIEGFSFQLKATIYPEETFDKSLIWASDNESVATVSSEGVVTTLKAGSASITATCGEAIGTCIVNVKDVGGVTLNPGVGSRVGMLTENEIALIGNDIFILVGQEGTIDLTMDSLLDIDPGFVWTLDEGGESFVQMIINPDKTMSAKFRGLGVGTTKYAVYTSHQNVLVLKGEITVYKESLLDHLKVTPTSLSLPQNALPYPMQVSIEGLYDRSISFESTQESVAIVDESRRIVPVGVGECSIIVRSGQYKGLAKECLVTVTSPIAESLEFDIEEDLRRDPPWIYRNNQAIGLYVGDSYQFKIKPPVEGYVLPDEIHWSSSDPDRVEIDDNGLILIKDVAGLADIIIKASAIVNRKEISAICYISYNEGLNPATSSIRLSRDQITILKGQSIGLTYQIEAPVEINQEVNWKVGDESIGSLSTSYSSKDVSLTGKTPGKTQITVSLGEVSATCEVIVKDPNEINFKVIENNSPDVDKRYESYIDGKDFYIRSGYPLTVEVELPEDLTEVPSVGFTKGWINNYNIYTTDNPLRFDFVAGGNSSNDYTYDLHYEQGGILLTGRVIVLKRNPITSLNLSNQEVTLEVNRHSSETIICDYLPKDASEPSIIITHSNGSIVSLGNSLDKEQARFLMNVNAFEPGQDIITITSDDDFATFTQLVVNVVKIPEGEFYLGYTNGDDFYTTPPTIKIGKELLIKVTPKEGFVVPSNISWSSSNPSVATVDINGRIKGISSGVSVITASTLVEGEYIAAELEVFVEPNLVTDLKLSRTTLDLYASETYRILSTITPHDASDQSLQWTSNAPSIASVSQDGVVTAHMVGEANITARTLDGSNLSAICQVKVKPTIATGITVTVEGATTLRATEIVQLTATVLPETTTDKSVKWQSDKPEVATVNESGVVTAVAVGKAVITATNSAGHTNSTTITVVPTLVESIELNRYTAQIKVQEGFKLTANVRPATATDKTVSWRSSAPGIVSADNEGNVVAITLGTATITCEACDGSGVKAECRVTVTSTATEGILIEAIGSTTLKANETLQLNATVLPATATDQSVSWQSENTDVALVNNFGLVTAVAVGETRITATNSGGQTASIIVTVVPTPVENISLDRNSLTLRATETATLIATVNPETATDKSLEWTSSNESVATVSQNGVITAVALGTAHITVRALDGSDVTAQCQVKVVETEVSSISIVAHGNTTLHASETVQLSAHLLPETATDKSVEWTSGSPEVADINENGLVTAYSVGVAMITATASSGKKATCMITVAPTLVTSISLNQSTLTMRVGSRSGLTATVYPATVTNASLNWNSSAPQIAQVDDEGNVTALREGQAVITCSATDGSNVTAKCVINVVDTEVEIITISAEGSTTLKINEKVQLNATILPETSTNKSVVWSSSNEEVAIVDAKGLVTAISEGTTTVTATSSNGLSDSIIITVIETQVSSITLSESTVILRANEVFNLIVTILPATATNKNIIWTVEDATVAEVGQDGLITAKSVGETVVTASTVDGSGLTANCRVTVIPTPATSITLTVHGEIDLEINETVQLTAEVLPETATDKTVVWTSSNPSVATVTETGLVTAVSGGETVITAMNSAGQYDRVTITVYPTEMPDSGLDYIYDEDFDIVDGDIEGEILGIYTVEGQYLGTLYHKLDPGIYVVRTTKGSYKVNITGR